VSVAEYHFVTEWDIEAPAQAVWDAIANPLEWPRWWRGVIELAEVSAGDGRGIGSVLHYVWRSRLPYNLVFDMRTTRVEPFRALEGVATGELAGAGRWRFDSRGPTSTHVRYEWDIVTTKAWMNLLAPILRPLFEWNHDVVMEWGREGLVRLLRAQH